MAVIKLFSYFKQLSRTKYIRGISSFPKEFIYTSRHAVVPIATNLFVQRKDSCTKICLSYFTSEVKSEVVDSVTFEQVCETTLESLTEYFDELVENSSHLKSADVSYSTGVLTVAFGEPYGTYVINRQTPNRQIWLSSPISGPKRYDYVSSGGYWIYKNDGQTLHQLLQNEICSIVYEKVDFSKCAHSRLSR